MGFGEIPSAQKALNKKEKFFDEDWGELRNIQVGEKELEGLLEKGGEEKSMPQCLYKMLITRSGFAEAREKVNSSLKMMESYEKQQVWYDDVIKELARNIK